MSKLVYLDNAATVWPKPPGVRTAMERFLDNVGANPGRAGHRLANEAARTVYEAREAVCSLLGGADPLRVVFGPNVTWALNLALFGLLRPGDKVVTSSIEHNAVMRPLRALEKSGVELSIVPCAADGELDIEQFDRAITPDTTLVVLTHASNMLGTIQPIVRVGARCRERGVLFLVDTAQTAGALPLHMEQAGVDLLAFTGHKSLCGPTGTGGLILGPRVDPHRMRPLILGGTGSASEHETQPDFLPDRLESGTPNVVGLAGLTAGIEWIRAQDITTIRAREQQLTTALLEGLSGVESLTLLGPSSATLRTATVSFTLASLSPSEAALLLDEEYGILCRAGLHCAPASHQTAGTFPRGAIRLSLGPMSSAHDVERAVAAVATLAQGLT